MAPRETLCGPGSGNPTDEDLARQARGGSRDSATALLERCRALMQYLIGEWFRRSGLRAEEWEEVRQEAWLGFLRAVRAYEDDGQGGRASACFRTFMNHVVWRHLSDWDRQRRRTELRYDRSADWA